MKTSSVMNGHVWDTVHTHTYNTWKKTVWSLAEFAYTFTRTMFLYYKTRHYAPSNIASLQVVLGGDYISIKIYSILLLWFLLISLTLLLLLLLAPQVAPIIRRWPRRYHHRPYHHHLYYHNIGMIIQCLTLNLLISINSMQINNLHNLFGTFRGQRAIQIIEHC